VVPPEPMVELEVDPGDPRRMLLASERTTFRSEDGGDSWRPAGRVEGEPARLKALDARHLYVVLETGAILESGDGAKSWKPVYQP